MTVMGEIKESLRNLDNAMEMAGDEVNEEVREAYMKLKTSLDRLMNEAGDKLEDMFGRD